MDQLELIKERYNAAEPDEKIQFLLDVIHGLTIMGRSSTEGVLPVTNEAIHRAVVGAFVVRDGKPEWNTVDRILREIPEGWRNRFIESILGAAADRTFS